MSRCREPEVSQPQPSDRTPLLDHPPEDRPLIMRLHLGAGVSCPEGEICVLADLVVDPASHRVTHLVVEPRHHPTLARLVPIELAMGEDLADGRLSLPAPPTSYGGSPRSVSSPTAGCTAFRSKIPTGRSESPRCSPCRRSRLR